MIGGRVLDASTLVDFALVRPYPQALVWTAVEEAMVLAIPSAALAVAWARVPASAHDALAVLLDLPNTVIEPLTAEDAREVGALLAEARPAGADAEGDPERVRAGQVVACGLRRGWPVVTAEAETLRSVDSRVEIDELP